MKHATYRRVCDAGWKVNYCIEAGGDFHPAYEANDFPGVIRLTENNECVPMHLCESMGWPHLEAQRTAIDKHESAYQQLMAM